MIDYQITGSLFKTIMPQKEPMLLLDGIISCDFDQNDCICGCTVGLNNNVALNDDGSLPSFALMEVMAQTMGAHSAYLTYVNSCGQTQVSVGLLMTVRSCNIYASAPLPAGTEITIHSQMIYSQDNITQAQVQARNHHTQEIIAEAKITACNTDFAQFMVTTN